jgi:hypothetical protein
LRERPPALTDHRARLSSAGASDATHEAEAVKQELQEAEAREQKGARELGAVRRAAQEAREEGQEREAGMQQQLASLAKSVAQAQRELLNKEEAVEQVGDSPTAL